MIGGIPESMRVGESLDFESGADPTRFNQTSTGGIHRWAISMATANPLTVAFAVYRSRLLADLFLILAIPAWVR